MAEKYPEWSPYNYVMQNPVKLIDPTGMGPDSIHTDEQGTVIAEYDDGDYGVYVHQNGTSVSDIDQQREDNNNTGGDGQHIGELGGIINIDKIYSNLLSQNMEEADDSGRLSVSEIN